jgi:hypothetical protein
MHPTFELPLQNHTCHTLSPEEIANPQSVLHDFFDFANLPEARRMMWDWFRTTVTGNYSKELDSSDRANIVIIFEQLEKLVEAAYLINEQRKLNQMFIN